jgi:uncharacterized membrane protein (UPF0127 family)
MPTDTTTLYSDKPLPKLPIVKLWLGKHELATEIAASPQELATGMMYREAIGEDEGMLFILPIPQRASFYMRNTKVHLSCAYIDAEGTILELHDLEPRNEEPVFAKSSNVQFVLETKQGWFERHGVAIGTVIRTENGSLRETFFRRNR